MRLALRVFILISILPSAGLAALRRVPTFEELTTSADLIVVGQTVAVDAFADHHGIIRSVVTLDVRRTLKGSAPGRVQVEVLGGRMGPRMQRVVGGPTFAIGEASLLFLRRGKTGEIALVDGAAGKLDYIGDADDMYLVRRELCVAFRSDFEHTPAFAVNASDFEREIGEYLSAAAPIAAPSVAVESTTALATGGDYSASAYLLDMGGPSRWFRFEYGGAIRWIANEPQQFITDTEGAIERGLKVWQDEPQSNVSWSFGGFSPLAETGSFAAGSEEYSQGPELGILFNDPADFIDDASAVAGVCLLTTNSSYQSSDVFTYGGENFIPLISALVVIQNGIFAPPFDSATAQATFENIVAHELGHALGFRHSAESDAALNREPTTTDALMNWSTAGDSALYLRAWDVNAVTAAYSGTCSPPFEFSPVVSTQFTLVGNRVDLTSYVRGSVTTTWFAGSPGDVGEPVCGGATCSVTPSEAGSLSYWARYTNSCGMSDSSEIEFSAYEPVRISVHPASQKVARGSNVTLIVNGGGAGPDLRLTWYEIVEGIEIARKTISGSTSDTLTLAGVAADTAYRVELAHRYDAISSDVASISVTDESCAADCGPAPPAGVWAEAVYGGVRVSWNAVPNAAGYEVARSAFGGRVEAIVWATAATAFDDLAIEPNKAYLYRVRSVDVNGLRSAFSLPDLATTIVPIVPVVAGLTVVRAAHLEYLRAATRAAESAIIGLASEGFDSLSIGTIARAGDVAELRQRVNRVRSLMGLPVIGFSDGLLTAGQTPIRAAHINELRDALR